MFVVSLQLSLLLYPSCGEVIVMIPGSAIGTAQRLGFQSITRSYFPSSTGCVYRLFLDTHDVN